MERDTVMMAIRNATLRKRLLRGETADEAMSVEIGRIGELEVELELVRRGWHALRLDTSHRAWNADLLCAKGPYRVAIQVKATDADKGYGHSKSLGFGYATGFLRDKKPVFNSKAGPLIAKANPDLLCPLGSPLQDLTAAFYCSIVEWSSDDGVAF